MEVKEMTMTLACKDVGVECPYVARAQNEDDLLADSGKHAKEVHWYTDEQLSDPKMLEELKKVIKTE